jgi:hypothetical protein
MTARLGPMMLDEDDLLIMRSVRKLLSQLRLSPRRAAVNWINERFESWPLTDRQGKTVEGATEHETEPPPMIKFISDHRAAEGQQGATAGAGDGQATAG